MNRAELLERIQDEFHTTAVELRAVETDTNNGYRYQLDATYRLFGLDPVTATTFTLDPELVFTAASYYVLRKFLRRAIPQVNVSLGGGLALSKSRAQTWDHLNLMIKDLREELIDGGYDPGPGGDDDETGANGGFVWGEYNLGFLGDGG